MDKSTFKILFDTHYASLCNLAYRIVGDTDKAEDIVQDMFVKLWDERHKINPEKSVKSLVFMMVKNHSLEVLRRDGIGARIAHHFFTSETDDQTIIEEEEIEKYELIDQIYVSIRQLPPKCGEVFTLSKVNGLSYIQIADKLNISVKTVENHMGKALKLLREIMFTKRK
ncbi:MAG: RNA polymerase sigma-70 factor [Saprospiraceae bacterium]|nr:RNA polymerase sigma-70 factor [Saprospiraceae bacterium]